MNNSTKNQIENLHKKHNKYPEYTDFHLSYTYNTKNREWVFNGYRCTKCGKTFKREHTVPHHYEVCKEINKVYKYNKEDGISEHAKIVDVYGNIWKPTEMIQKFSKKKP